MRGCRFCTKRPVVWVEYARAEMEWLSRMEAKRAKAAGKTSGNQEQKRVANTTDGLDEDGNMQFDDDSDEDVADDELILPDPDAESGNGGPKVFNDQSVQKLEHNPALDGAIPLAIFQIVQKQPFFDAIAAEAFFDIFAPFSSVSSQPKLLQHVLDCMITSYPSHPATCSCLVRQPLVGVDPHTAEYPKALRESLARLKTGLEETEDMAGLISRTIGWIDPVLAVEDLDSGIRVVLEHTKRKLEFESAQPS